MKVGKDFENRAGVYLRQAAYGRVVGESWSELSVRLGVPARELKAMVILCPKQWRRWRKLAEQYVKLLALSNGTAVQPRGPRIVKVEQ